MNLMTSLRKHSRMVFILGLITLLCSFMLYNICKVSKEGLKAKGSKGKASKSRPAKKLSKKQQLAAQKAAQKSASQNAAAASDKTAAADNTANDKTAAADNTANDKTAAVDNTANDKTAAVDKQNMAKQNAIKTPITSYNGSGSITIANLKSVVTGAAGPYWTTLSSAPLYTALGAAVKTQPSWWTGSLSDWTNMSTQEQASQILQVGSW